MDKEKHLFSGISGVVLTGGKSSRYGINKAYVKVCGTPMIVKVIDVMRQLFKNIVLITNDPEEYASLGLSMYEDIVKGLGPLGGIYTALMSIKEEAGFFVACDMPFIRKELIEYMIEVGSGFDAVVPRLEDKMEPLHAIYSKECIPAIKRVIDNGEFQVNKIYPKISIRYVDREEIARFDPEFKSFFNINRPDDLRRLIAP